MADPTVDPLIESGKELASLGRLGATITEPDPSAVELVAGRIGNQAAVDAAAVAAAFEGLNRIVDGVGLPVSRASRRDHGDIIDTLRLDTFSHATHGA